LWSRCSHCTKRPIRRRTPQGKKPPSSAQIAATDTQLDNLVYTLYGLTDAEIKIIELESHGGTAIAELIVAPNNRKPESSLIIPYCPTPKLTGAHEPGNRVWPRPVS